MRKIKLERVNSLILFFVSFAYLEIMYKIVMHYKVFSLDLINIILFVVFYSLIAKFISSIFKDNYNKLMYYVFLFLTCLYFAVQIIVFKIFGFGFDLSLLATTDQVTKFASDGVVLITENILYVILCFLPIIISIILNKKIETKRLDIKQNTVVFLVAFVFYLLFIGSMKVTKSDEYSAYKLYFVNHNMELSLKKLGVINSMFLDLERTVLKIDEKVVITNPIINNNEEETTKYDYNNLKINFDSLIDNSNGILKQMHEYFNNEKGTLKNEYTGYFEGKNLILFMAESFNEIAVSEELTPTLYKLVNNGFVFNDFYTPTISSTIGGEFQELTGLVASPSILNDWKDGKNTFPFGIATKFKEKGYKTYAFHNHSYTFQNRHKYLKTLGFDNYKACFNGLEKKINCKIWPESDISMIEATFNDYATSSEPFMVFYASVSGHGEYNWYNYMSLKHKKEVKDLPYSDPVKAYIAAQMEFDQSLELLINKLEENNLLDNTVIAFVGDHYPYFLSVKEVNELSSYEKEGIISINHSNFVLWNNNMENVYVDKVGSQIDVLPTIYNVFGIDYDSRLIIGKDIMSTEPGLAIFGNRSWVSDYGTYYAANDEFIPKKGVEVPDNYVSNMNILVSNKTNMSKLIITHNYYKYIDLKEN